MDRKKGGICTNLVAQDFAEGITREELEDAIEFAGETSGFQSGSSVRGLFGRGLKVDTVKKISGIYKFFR